MTYVNPPNFSETGKLAALTTGLVNTAEAPYHHPMIQYQISNEPVIDEEGKLVTVPTRELVLLYSGRDIADPSVDREDPELKPLLETRLVEYRTEAIFSFGDHDLVAPETALAMPELEHAHRDVVTAIQEKRMDVIYVRPDAPETGSRVADKKVRRQRNRSINAWLIRRVNDSNALSDDRTIWLDQKLRERGFGQRFVGLTGTVTTKGNSRTTEIVAFVWGRSPDEKYKAKKRSQPGESGRGYAFVVPIGYIDQLRWSYFSDLTGIHAEWLKSHPTPARFAQKLKSVPLAAPAGEVAANATA